MIVNFTHHYDSQISVVLVSCLHWFSNIKNNNKKILKNSKRSSYRFNLKDLVIYGKKIVMSHKFVWAVVYMHVSDSWMMRGKNHQQSITLKTKSVALKLSNIRQVLPNESMWSWLHCCCLHTSHINEFEQNRNKEEIESNLVYIFFSFIDFRYSKEHRASCLCN